MDHDDSASLSARRRRTRSQVLALLSQSGSGLTRGDLSLMTGLSASAISDCVGSLRESGLIAESAAGPQQSARGRRPTVITLADDNGIVIGMDVDHTQVTVAVADIKGDILGLSTGVLDLDHRPQQAFDLAAQLTRQALEDNGLRMDDVRSIAAGVARPLDLRTQVVRLTAGQSAWSGISPADELSHRFGRPVAVGNDADFGARGELISGAAQGMENFVYVKVSDRIGSGLVLAGRTYHGAAGLAGEIGHIQVPGATQLCRCGNRGCLGTIVSLTNVRAELAHVLNLTDEADVPPLNELSDHPAASRVLAESGRTVGRVLADLVNSLNPEAIILGGQLGGSGRSFADGVAESVVRYAQPASAESVAILSSKLEPRAEVRGAIATAIATAQAEAISH
ncbi:ROK family protein [Kribbella sp. NPDC051587]|uniref:ROK family transcriptional regulator n=1 Tax=Kribbella sp. NPDC051587 TaxID=3364119 RepID=UPI0037A14A5E